MKSTSELQRQYLGYLRTPPLWLNSYRGLKQFTLAPLNDHSFNRVIQKRFRLGALTEQFVFHEWEQHEGVSILLENLQIQSDLRTLGELDALIQHQDQIYHIEIVYKFYLLDPLEGWIGPNRKDSLKEKTEKMIQHQLPILKSPESDHLLRELNIPVDQILQRVWFKGQLFTAPSNENAISDLNEDCIYGYYYRVSELKQFNSNKFYLPSKHDWLTEPHVRVPWISYNDLLSQLTPLMEEQRSPMCWRKDKKGNLYKLFIVWWD